MHASVLELPADTAKLRPLPMAASSALSKGVETDDLNDILCEREDKCQRTKGRRNEKSRGVGERKKGRNEKMKCKKGINIQTNPELRKNKNSLTYLATPFTPRARRSLAAQSTPVIIVLTVPAPEQLITFTATKVDFLATP